MFNNIYKGKKVFLTGHTGFKGSWLSLWLTQLGAQVCGYSLTPATKPSMFKDLHIENHIAHSIIGDILDEKNLETTIQSFQPDIVFHLAAQPLVRQSYTEPILTYKTNVMGSLYVLEYSRRCPSVKAFVNVTTDKCYANHANNHIYREEDPLGGYDMYASSKACVEMMSSSFRQSFLHAKDTMALATARAGNVVGGGDWASDRLVPDCIRALFNHLPIEIRNPLAIRPWQYILEPLSGYLLLGQKLLEDGKKYAESFNFGPNQTDTYNVIEVAQKIVKNYGQGTIVTHPRKDFHEDHALLLDIRKAAQLLNWTPTYTLTQALAETVEWYKHFYQQDINMLSFTIQQIENYEEILQTKHKYS